ncbi:unnamed protein product [Thelazia callipaeda]|uniref:Dolichyl-diphosphooligosaccharide--protein glycosyltransferase subunit 2 n=1 Tax=Thelazia callipaeda TaxID=103827 RepID=A0A0N5CXI8_THECL|nr:unnamed protein product [Thelazia callipaeda]
MGTESVWCAFFVSLLLFAITECVTPFLNNYLDASARNSLNAVFLSAIESDQLSAIHHGLAGLELAGIPIDANKNQVLCGRVKKVNNKELVQLYHALSAANVLKDCALSVPNARETVEAVLKQDPIISQNLYFALAVASYLKLKVDYDSFSKALTSALAKDDGVMSLAYGLNAATFLDIKTAEKFSVRIEDLIGQADEVDGRFLVLEGGLSITAFGVHGIYSLADKLNKSPNVKSDEAVKLANYLLSRRNVQSYRDAHLLLLTLKKFASNSFQIPVVFSLASEMSIDTSKPLVIRVSNVLGESVGPLSVTLDTATHTASKEVVASRKALKQLASDKTSTLYEMSIENAKQRGFYKIVFTAGSQDKRVVGTNGASLMVKVMTKVRIENVTLAVFDRELVKPSSPISVKEGSKLGKILEADVHSKMEIRFKITEARTGETIVVHQTFVAFVHQVTHQEIIFVATPDANRGYVFDVDFEKVAKDFEGLSGRYTVRLIVGDAAISYAFDWNLVDVNLRLPSLPSQKIKKSERVVYEKLPEIKHTFREPEKRPPQTVSNTFVFLCAFPLLIVLILWLRIGINFGNLPASPFVLVFHGGLIGIFGLYFVFWIRLTMFETLKYLSLVGAVTFFSGNRLLRILAAKRK